MEKDGLIDGWRGERARISREQTQEAERRRPEWQRKLFGGGAICGSRLEELQKRNCMSLDHGRFEAAVGADEGPAVVRGTYALLWQGAVPPE